MPSFRHLVSGIFVAAVAAVAGCASSTYDKSNSLGVMPLQPPAPLWLGAVSGLGGSGSGSVNGAAAATPSQVPGWTHVMLSLDNSAAGAVYTWSLRSGNCGGEGSVIGPSDRYTRFDIHADGTGAVEAFIPANLSQSQTYAVIATPVSPGTASPTASSAPVACANLTRTSM
jgi:hypothetical protein